MQFPRERLKVSALAAELEIRVDPSQLRQIVWNLCENALKHGVQGSPEQIVEIRYGRMTPTARPFLEIADRGPGVPAEHLERIFEPFFSGGRGTGLGLFLARELAQTNGATLLYEARSGGVAAFSVWCSQTHAGGGLVLMNETLDSRDSGTDKPIVLIVDDEPDLLELVSPHVSRMNLQARTAADVSSARPPAESGKNSICV